MTEIISNGSKWAGESPDSVEQLLTILSETALDRTFEDYGNFVMTEGEGSFHFWGNFFNLSHVFSIRTNDADVVESLTTAIRANQERPDYKSQHKPVPFYRQQREQLARIRKTRNKAVTR